MSITMRLQQLPLLGSNQDSPDPESVTAAGFARESAGFTGRTAPEPWATPHENPHGFSHPTFHVGHASLAARRREEWDRLRAAFGYRCAYCGKKPPILFREHTVPKGRGGDDSIENIVPSCSRCNTVKGSRTPLEWFLTFDQPKPQRPRRTWPLMAQPCTRCGGQLELRTRGKAAIEYTRCQRCRVERSIQQYPASPFHAPTSRGTV